MLLCALLIRPIDSLIASVNTQASLVTLLIVETFDVVICPKIDRRVVFLVALVVAAGNSSSPHSR